MIKITSQSGTGQYSDDKQITKWCDKRCNWIVLPEFENEKIDWYGRDSDYPAGYTEAEYEESHPNWQKCPDISITWYFNSIDALVKQFGDRKYWEKWAKVLPYPVHREWGYFTEDDYPNLQSVIDGSLPKYCDWNTHASEIKIRYNLESKTIKND